MDVEAEAENVACGDCHTQQSVATSLCSEQLQYQLRALKIQHGDENNENTFSSTAVKDSCTSGNAECNEIGDCLPSCTASDKGSEIQHIMCYMDCDNNGPTSAETDAADLMSSDTNIVVTNAETEDCFFQCDTANDGECTDCLPTENMQAAHETDSCESVSVGDCDNDSRLLTSECHECTKAAPDVCQLVNINSEEKLGQCFTVSSESQTQCTSVSLQDAFMHFLKKKQVR